MLNKSEYYLPPIAALWKGRRDGPNVLRFHEIVKCHNLTEKIPTKSAEKTYGILGFACDEGINRNHGRLGAARGPAEFRRALANFPVLTGTDTHYYDFGDIVCLDDDLEGSQEALSKAVAEILRQGIQLVVIGGGHEVAWGNYQGIEAVFPKQRCSIINFDAHFDMRPTLGEGFGTSGTSFLQIAQKRHSDGLEFDYTCIGIQRVGNTQSLFDEAKKRQVNYILAEEIHLKGIDAAGKELNEVLKKADHVYLTICLDVFAAPFAPGVSAPQPLGLYPWQVIPLLKMVNESGKVVSMDIAELSPNYDQDGITAKLAASLVSTLWNS